MNPGLTTFRFDSPVTAGVLQRMGRVAFCQWLHKQVSCLWGCTPACATLGFLCECESTDAPVAWSLLHDQLWAWKGPLATLAKEEIRRRSQLGRN